MYFSSKHAEAMALARWLSNDKKELTGTAADDAIENAKLLNGLVSAAVGGSGIGVPIEKVSIDLEGDQFLVLWLVPFLVSEQVKGKDWDHPQTAASITNAVAMANKILVSVGL